MFLREKTKKLKKFSFHVMTSLNDVITSKFLLIWKPPIKTFHMRYNTIWYCIVLAILKFDLGVSKFRPAARPMKVIADRPQKIISWVAAHMLLSHQVWSWSDKSYSKIRVSLTTYFYHYMTLTFDLDLEMVPSISWLSLMDNYTRDVIWVQGLLCEETIWTQMITYKKKQKKKTNIPSNISCKKLAFAR
jgi:hypothetical protein